MGKRTKDLENNEELVSGDSKIKKVALYVLGIILGLIFLSPFYILIINSFKSKKEIFKDTLTMPIEWVNLICLMCQVLYLCILALDHHFQYFYIMDL